MSKELKPQKPIKFRAGIKGGVNSIIPKGIAETITIEVIDGYATIHFRDNKITRKLAEGDKEAVYSERVKKAIYKYPGKTQKALFGEIMDKFKELGATFKK